MATSIWRGVLGAGLVAGLGGAGLAQDQIGPIPAAMQAVAAQAAQPKQPGEFPSFDEVTKDMVATTGLMTFYRYKESDLTKDQTKLLCVIPKGLLKQDLLLGVNLSRGNLAGFQWLDGLVRWEQVGRQIALVAPDTRFVEKPGSPISEAVTRTYRPSFIFSLPIVTLTPQGDPVIDLSQAVFSPAPLVDLPFVPQGAQVRREISRFNTLKSFPDNTLIDVDLAIGNRMGMGGSTIGVSYAFRRLPDLKSYKPRNADERVGYFTTDRQDWTTRYTEREMIERYVNRWDLKKKDPSLDLSPPEKPIVFIIEKSVPLQWRRFVSEGILEWNKAYEKVGIVGAIVVQQQTEDNEFANVDPADARYNFIQWTVRNSVMAMGPSRPDPRTGQILDADIVVDDSWIRHFNESSEIFSPKAWAAMIGPETLAFMEKNPSYLPPGVTTEQIKQARLMLGAELIQSGDASGIPEAPTLSPASRRQCEMALGLMQQLSIAQLVGQQAKAKGLPKIPDHLIGSALKHIVMHEVGHTLGLRHNFKASAWLPMDQIRTKRDAGEPFVASVMDYTPLAFYSDDDLNKVRSFASDTIGPYDLWAIEYGYGTPKEGEAEPAYLKKITAHSADRANAYATDEDTMGLISADPLANRYDLSSDPVAWAGNQIELTDKLLGNIRDWAQTSEEPNHYLRTAYLELMFERSRNLAYVSRLIGGQLFSRSRASDPNAPAPLTLIDAKQQRQALDLLSKTVFTADFYKADPDLLNRLTPGRWWGWTDFPTARVDFPYHQFVEAQYGMSLFVLASPQVLQRVYDSEVKSDSPEKMTAAELVKSVRDIIWSELKNGKLDGVTDAKPFIPAIRRNMQNAHLQYLLATAESEPGRVVSSDLRNLTRYALRELSEQIGATLQRGGGKLDFATRGHLVEAKSRIDRTLEKPIVDVSPRGGMIILMGEEGQK